MSKVDKKVDQTICIDISSEESSNSDSDFELKVVPKKFIFKKKTVNESSVSKSNTKKTISKPKPTKKASKVGVLKGKGHQVYDEEVAEDQKLGPGNQVGGGGKKIHPFFNSSSSSSSSGNCSPCPGTSTSTSKRESDEENRVVEGATEAEEAIVVVDVDADAYEDSTYLAKVVDFEETKSKWKDLMGLMQRNQNNNKDQQNSKKGFKRPAAGDYFGQSFNKKAKMDTNQAQLSALTLSGSSGSTTTDSKRGPIVPRIRKDLTRPFYGNGAQIDIVSASSTDNDQAKEVVENPRKYPCPLYKKMPGTRFSVDAFSYGVIPDIDVYFLSHFHSDHYQGLKKSFSKTLICTEPTANLVRMKLYVNEENIRRLELNKVYIIQGTEVVLIDANHCPGSVMFIFRLPNGVTYLHTGDFRYTSEMLDNHFLEGLRIDCLYLDTTYCDPKYNFPSQTDAIQHVTSLVKRHIDYRPKTLIVCGSYVIGKERVFINIADAIGSKVFCVKDKMRVIRALENSSFNSFLCDTEINANIHVVPMTSLKPSDLATYLDERKSLYTNILGIKPTGWTYGFSGCNGFSIKKHFNDTVTMISVPYSEHSSFSELKEFITVLNPLKVQPTVNASKKEELLTIINKWIKG